MKLRKIRGRRQGQADIQHLDTGAHQAGGECQFDTLRVRTEVMADDNAWCLGVAQKLVKHIAETETQRLHAG